MLIVNLYAGPSTGKSLMSSDVLAKLKRMGVKAEAPPEPAKQPAQRGDVVALRDQLSLFARVNHQIEIAELSGAEVVVLDSPILLSLVYRPVTYYRHFDDLVREADARWETQDYFLDRSNSGQFCGVGRVHDERESHRKDREIRAMLLKESRTFRVVDTSEESARLIATLAEARVREVRLAAAAAHAATVRAQQFVKDIAAAVSAQSDKCL